MGKNPWFAVYPDDKKATHFSMAGGGARLLALLLTAAAALATIALFFMGFRMVSEFGAGTALFFLLDEMDEMLLMVFMMWSGVVVLRYLAHVFSAKAEMAADRESRSLQEVSAES